MDETKEGMKISYYDSRVFEETGDFALAAVFHYIEFWTEEYKNKKNKYETLNGTYGVYTTCKMISSYFHGHLSESKVKRIIVKLKELNLIETCYCGKRMQTWMAPIRTLRLVEWRK